MFNKRKKSNGLRLRVAQRKATNMPGLYKVLDRDRFFARSYLGTKSPMVLIDISTTGCAFRTSQDISKGSYIAIEFDKLSEEYLFNPPIHATCEAVYSLDIVGSTKRVGTKFVEIDRTDVEKIREFTE